MTKLIVSIATLGSGGAERVLSILSSSLVDSFDEVQYVMWEGGEVFYDFDSRIKIVSLPEISGHQGRTKQVWTFRKYVKRERPDLILSFLTPYNMLVLLSTIGLHQKVVVAERTDPKRLLAGGKPMLWLRDILYRRAKGIITQTKYAQSCYGGKLASKTLVIFNPILMDESQVGKAINVEKNQTMVSVGRLEPVKDQMTMIKAFKIFHAQHPNYRLVIFGDGTMRDVLNEEIAKSGLTGSVNLAGRSNKVWEEMVKADAFLLTSLAEGMSNAMIEAMCLGLPVLSTKVAGATDFIKDGENGFLVDLKDEILLAKRMCQIAESSELRLNMGKEASIVYSLLRSDIVAQQWVGYLLTIALEC